MGRQVTPQGAVVITDGFKTEVRLTNDSLWTELGRTKGDAACPLNYDKSTEIYSDGTTNQSQYRNMTMVCGFELADLKPSGLNILASGITEHVTNNGTPVSTIPDQTIAAGWEATNIYAINMQTSPTDTTLLRITAPPVITSITHNAPTPQVLVENTHYTIVKTNNTFSGWAVQFIGANMTTQPASDHSITIVYGTNTPVEMETLYAGSPSQTAIPFQFRLSYTDEQNRIIWDLFLPKCEIDSGALQFGLKGVEAGGSNTMPISFTASIDNNQPTGRQLIHMSTSPGGKL